MNCSGYILCLVYVLIFYKQVLACPDGCAKCTYDGNVQQCDSCEGGYWLTGGNACSLCPSNCERCTNDNNCTKCKPKFWDIRTNINCGAPCQKNCTNSGCDDTTGHCYGCSPGFYGAYCYQNCDLCKDGQCDLRKCKNGCKEGYFESTDNNFECKKCYDHCLSCLSETNCTQCEIGYYIHYDTFGNNFCSLCQSFCEDCVIYNECSACKPGRYGPTCSNDCDISNCKTCNEVDSVVKCTECRSGYSLRNGNCILGTNVCSQYCSSQCGANGDCLGGCKDDWTGIKCTVRCADQCRKCDQNNEKSCKICAGDFFTTACSVPCSSYCIALSGLVTCDINNGTCLHGCDNGYWGDKCDKQCSDGCNSVSCKQSNGFCDTCDRTHFGESCLQNCSKHCIDTNTLSVICNKTTGECVSGCEDGYSGNTCQVSASSMTSLPTVLPVSQTTKNKNTGTTERVVDDDKGNVIAIGAGAGGGLLALVILIVIIVCIVKRKRRKGSNPQDEHSDQEKKIQQPSPNTENMYARPNKPRKEEHQEYIYAQPNKTKKNIHHNKEEISGPSKTYDNVVIDLDTEGNTNDETVDQAEETDIDAILLENIDDEPRSVIQTEVNIPASDTYYNMASLKRSRVQISKLFEYIENKTDFENEFKKLPQGLTRTCNEALKPHNRAKNRYNGIYAYDATRVVLRSKSFINANTVDGQGQSQVSYIASLGPTKSTMNNFVVFWEMVWQENSNKIVMLTNLEEAKKMKCEQYWPERGCQKTYGDFTVTSIAEKVFSDFAVREFTIAQNSETRKVTQYHYTAWPDKTVPHTVASLVEFRDKVEQQQTPITGPMIVHCSAGIGRTGTYIALDILIREGKAEDSVDIFGRVIALRGYRTNMVQNTEQYIFLHHCVLYALTCEPDHLPISDIPHVFTDEKVSAQFQSCQNLRQLTSADKRLTKHTKSRKENRKGADIPDDDHRVRLTLAKHDYINAVYVNGYEETVKFILAQTPLPNTVEDFVSMLYQERCPYIVCLDEENIENKTVAQYIPPANKVLRFGHYQVTCTKSDSKEDFIVRELKVSRIGSPTTKDLKVQHYQCTGWKHSEIVPLNVPSFLNLIIDVEKNRKSSHSKQPMVVHCLNGAKRSGIFCVVSILLEKMAVDKEMSVLNTVCQVRERRRAAVQNTEQLRFCYTCIEEMLEMPETTNTYYNI